MQDFQSIADFAGRILVRDRAAAGASRGTADLQRLRGYPCPPPATPPPHPIVKCPRCDSTNTKFCYYNNYNLSQPRHFCKSCRRYWTKGGVLRNVPVGGGCRKSKRSSTTPSSKSSSKNSASTSDDKSGKNRRTSPSSRPSSNNSALTTAATTTIGTVDVFTSAPFASNLHTNPNGLFDSLSEVEGHLCPATEIFQEATAGGLTSLMTVATSTATITTSPTILRFGLVGSSPLRFPGTQQTVPEDIGVQPQQRQEFAEHTINLQPMDGVPGAVAGAGGLAALDWAGQVDPGLFDLGGAVDAGAYWNQSHWGDTDPTIYLP